VCVRACTCVRAVQYSSFNETSGNAELIVRHLRNIAPRWNALRSAAPSICTGSVTLCWVIWILLAWRTVIMAVKDPKTLKKVLLARGNM
jgi:hypothetical protein